MAILPFNLISFVFLFPIVMTSVNGDCSYSNCATNMKQPSYNYKQDPIPFPFRTPDQPLSCGLPGFDLRCNNSDKTPVLRFPSGQSFSVESISISLNYIEISDPERCLIEKLMQFNPSGTPFYFKYFTKLSIYSCPLSFGLTFDYYMLCYEVKCKTGEKRTIVCKTQPPYYATLHKQCEFIRDANVPGIWTSYGFSTVDSAELSWDLPGQCQRCNSKGRDCRRDPGNSTLIKCFRRSLTTGGVVMIVLAAVALPILLGVVYKCYIRRSQRITRGVRVSYNEVDATRGQNRAESMHSTDHGGLEQATLDRYPIVVVGDSGRILMYMEDKVCPICLSEYEPGHMIKSLPECLHRFHSDCIDEWLHAKVICPICRTMPPRISS